MPTKPFNGFISQALKDFESPRGVYGRPASPARIDRAHLMCAFCEHRGRMSTQTSSSIDSFVLSLYAFDHDGCSR